MEETRVEIELNPRERRVYDRLRSAVSDPERAGPTQLMDLILLLPDLAVLAMRLMGDPRVPVSSKLIAGLGVGYLLAPVDLIPVVIFGPIGLVDDLLILSAAFSRLLNRVHPDVVRSHWSGKGDALDAIQRLTRWSESQVTRRVSDVRNWLPAGRGR